VDLKLTGNLTVINGYEDLYIQWTYGRALVEGMQQVLGANRATLKEGLTWRNWLASGARGSQK
jgi:hypothetical protein